MERFVARIRETVADMPAEPVLVVAKLVAQALLCYGPDRFFATELHLSPA